MAHPHLTPHPQPSPIEGEGGAVERKEFVASAAVPEPTTLALFGFGLAGHGLIARPPSRLAARQNATSW